MKMRGVNCNNCGKEIKLCDVYYVLQKQVAGYGVPPDMEKDKTTLCKECGEP